MIENNRQTTEEILHLEDLVLPTGIEITLEEIFRSNNPEPILVDKENMIQGGVVTYLIAIKK
jgi:hypothetical protein